ncbi:MAG: cytochrome c biogenesis protein ResB [Deltaproteobacteria bacterium]|nr:cytochrome c biogenesis protein ResB [Deltaproteobacteria bacterium]
MNKIWRLFLSRRFAIFLLIMTAGLLFIATLFPDVYSLKEDEAVRFQNEKPYLYLMSRAFGLQGITTSPIFLIFPFLTFISTIICTLSRIQTRIKAKETGALGKVFRIERDFISNLSAEDARQNLLKIIGTRWDVKETSAPEGISISASKGSVGFWGSMLFHLGLLVIIIAAIITSLTLFAGEMVLTKGSIYSLDKQGLLRTNRIPILGANLPKGNIMLEEWKAVYKDDRFPVDYAATVKVGDRDDSFTKEIRVNAPLKYNGFQYNIDNYGFNPSFLIKGKDGKIILDAEVLLMTRRGQEDSFDIPDTDYKIYTVFYPDLIMTKKGPRNKSEIPKNPGFLLKVNKGGKIVGEGIVSKSGEAEIGGLKISFYDLKPWVHALVSRDYGANFMFAGFIFMAIGLLIRFVFYDRGLKIIITHSEGKSAVKVSGCTKYFPSVFENELKEIEKAVAC